MLYNQIKYDCLPSFGWKLLFSGAFFSFRKGFSIHAEVGNTDQILAIVNTDQIWDVIAFCYKAH